MRVVRMQVGGKVFDLEVADTDARQQYGLMNRRSMPKNHGMIFVFPDERPRGFWMKNTLIPLDILYLDAGGRVVSMHRMEPEARDERGRLRSYPSAGPAQYAIELNAGMAEIAGVRRGDVLAIPDAVRPRR